MLLRLLPFFLAAALPAWPPGLPSNSNNYAVLPAELQQHSISGIFFAGDDSRVFHNFADFKKARLRLPEKKESFRPLILEEHLFPRDPLPGIIYRCSGPDYFYFKRIWSGINPISTGSNPAPLPAHRLIQNRKCDLDGDDLPEIYILHDGIATVWDGSRRLWQSPPDWWVDYLFLGDVNNDGTLELSLSVWKEGNFGSCKPFWMKKDDKRVRNHLFIFKLTEGQIKPVWQSSNLDYPNYWAGLIDLDGSGENKLIVLEGSYTDPRKREITLWKWNGWGFTRTN